MTTLDPPGPPWDHEPNFVEFWYHFEAHWGPKWGPKCLQNDSNIKLDFRDDFCFVLGRPSAPKRGHFWDENLIFLRKVWKRENVWKCTSPEREAWIWGSEGPKMTYFWYLERVKNGSRNNDVFGCNFGVFWLPFWYQKWSKTSPKHEHEKSAEKGAQKKSARSYSEMFWGVAVVEPFLTWEREARFVWKLLHVRVYQWRLWVSVRGHACQTRVP